MENTEIEIEGDREVGQKDTKTNRSKQRQRDLDRKRERLRERKKYQILREIERH